MPKHDQAALLDKIRELEKTNREYREANRSLDERAGARHAVLNRKFWANEHNL